MTFAGFRLCFRHDLMIAAMLWAAPAIPDANAQDAVHERPPLANPVEVNVERGRSVRITLRADGKPRQRIEFMIREQPRFGELDPAEGGSGIERIEIVYRHRGDGAQDTFTYACRSAGSGVSIAAKVTIKITDPPPLLEVTPSLLDFGQVKMGEKASREFWIRNAGGGVLEGQITLPPELSIESDAVARDGKAVNRDGNAVYSLRAGERRRWLATYAPREARRFRAEILVRKDAMGKLTAIGTGLALFAVDDTEALLRVTGTDGARGGRLGVRNLGSEPLALAIVAEVNAAVEVEERVIVQPWEWRAIDVRIPGTHTSRLAGVITLSAGVQSEKIRVTAPPAPALIAFAGPGGNIVESGPDGHSRFFRLVNRGGETASVTWQILGDTAGREIGGEFSIKPGDTIRVPAPEEVNGGRESRAVFRMGEVALVGVITGTAEQASSAPDAKSAARASGGRVRALSGAGVETAGPVADVDRLSPEEAAQFRALQEAFIGPEETGPDGPVLIGVDSVSSNAAQLRWAPPRSGIVDDYRMELRRIRPGEGTKPIESEWSPLDGVAITTGADGIVTGALRGLPTHRLHVVRVRAKLNDGQWTKPSGRVVFRTSPTEAERRTMRRVTWGLGLAVGAALGVAGWFIIRRRASPAQRAANAGG